CAASTPACRRPACPPSVWRRAGAIRRPSTCFRTAASRPSTTSTQPRGASRSRCCWPERHPASTGPGRMPTRSCRHSRVDDNVTILVAARDEEESIAETVAALHRLFPGVEVIVADGGSRDATAECAEAAGAAVLRFPRRGKGEALSAAERAAPPGALLLV